MRSISACAATACDADSCEGGPAGPPAPSAPVRVVFAGRSTLSDAARFDGDADPLASCAAANAAPTAGDCVASERTKLTKSLAES